MSTEKSQIVGCVIFMLHYLFNNVSGIVLKNTTSRFVEAVERFRFESVYFKYIPIQIKCQQ